MSLLLIVIAYFLPTIVAVVRNRPNTLGVYALNLFLGWTGIGWIAALVLALM